MNCSYPSQITEWSMAVFIMAIEAIILWRIWTDKIDIKHIIAEDDGSASLSRFQMLFFTFVIGSILTTISLCGQPPGFPADIPTGVLGLMGISGGSYVLSKGIQKSYDAKTPPEKTGDAS